MTNSADLFIRRDVWSLEMSDPWDSVITGFARAVAAMQARPVDDPTSWAYQAAIHGTYAAVPIGAEENKCQHASWFFLPWHRMYTYWLERIARKVVVKQVPTHRLGATVLELQHRRAGRRPAPGISLADVAGERRRG